MRKNIGHFFVCNLEWLLMRKGCERSSFMPLLKGIKSGSGQPGPVRIRPKKIGDYY